MESPGLARFVHHLATEGRAVVFRSELVEPPEPAVPLLRALAVKAARELSGDAPVFSPAVALWAARLLYEACRCTVCRDLGEDVIARAFAVACPEERGPATDWSADLMFRHLPVVLQWARHLSKADPLVEALRKLAAAWPLSSVGIPDLGAVAVNSFYSHPALRRLYADRIVMAGDQSRLEEPRVLELLQADVGLHHDLAPALRAKLFADPGGPSEDGIRTS